MRIFSSENFIQTSHLRLSVIYWNCKLVILEFYWQGKCFLQGFQFTQFHKSDCCQVLIENFTKKKSNNLRKKRKRENMLLGEIKTIHCRASRGTKWDSCSTTKSQIFLHQQGLSLHTYKSNKKYKQNVWNVIVLHQHSNIARIANTVQVTTPQSVSEWVSEWVSDKFTYWAVLDS